MDDVAEKFHQDNSKSGNAMNFTTDTTRSSYETRMIDVFQTFYDLHYDL